MPIGSASPQVRKRLFRLVYASEFGPKFPVRPEDQARSIRSIVEGAVRNNARLGVTSFLLATETRFLQVIEGPGEAVAQVYGRILDDRRQAGARLLGQAEAAERLFGGAPLWARRLSGAEALEAAQDAGADAGDLCALGLAEAVALLRSVSAREAGSLKQGAG